MRKETLHLVVEVVCETMNEVRALARRGSNVCDQTVDARQQTGK